MAFKMTFTQMRLMESLPMAEFQFEKENGAAKKVLWENDLIEKDNYDGQVYIALSGNGDRFLEANKNGKV